MFELSSAFQIFKIAEEGPYDLHASENNQPWSSIKKSNEITKAWN